MGKDHEGIIAVHLAPREQELLRFAAMGLTNEVIANRLGIAHSTVANALSHALDKLQDGGVISPLDRGMGSAGGRGSTALAAQLAAEHGIISPLPIEEKDALDFARRVVRPK